MIDLSPDRQHILERTAGLWEPLRDRRIFITGGTGFFGTWLLQSFLWANAEFQLCAKVVVLSRNWQAFCAKMPQLAANPAVSCHAGDVRDFTFPHGHFSHVIHAATDSSAKLNQENPLLMLDTIVQGTRRTLDFARHCKAEKFLLTSSGAVYGRQPSDLTYVPEDCLAHRTRWPRGRPTARESDLPSICAFFTPNSIRLRRRSRAVSPSSVRTCLWMFILPSAISFATGFAAGRS